MSDMFDQPVSAPAFTGARLDRADEIRTDEAKLAQAWQHEGAYIIEMDGLDPVPADAGVLATRPIGPDDQLADHALLGLREDGAPLFVTIARSDVPHGAGFSPKIWELAPLLSPEELALFGGARSLVDWHARDGFCPKCGHATVPAKGGWARRCTGCEAEHFPRVDPVVIMLAEYRGKVLIGRGASWPPRRFSALAGFVEPGEAIEEAVRREIREEAGIVVDRVDYLTSQPWPFPSSLMIACIAQARGDRLKIDTNELSEAIWVSRDEVRAAFAEDENALFLPPSSVAIAHHMLKHWLER